MCTWFAGKESSNTCAVTRRKTDPLHPRIARLGHRGNRLTVSVVLFLIDTVIIFSITSRNDVSEDLLPLSPRNAAPPVPYRGSTGAPKSMDFTSSGAPAASRKVPADTPFVSYLHMCETIPAGSDPVSGKSETSFCFISIDDRETGRNHGVDRVPESSTRAGNRRYGWCIMFRTMMIDAYGGKIIFLRHCEEPPGTPLLDMTRVGG
jgi:hypothetical protein